MSVYESRRKESQAQFIVAARTFRLTTLRICKKFPKSYQYSLTNKIVQTVQDIYLNCVRGNTIFITENMPLKDYSMRHNYLQTALCDTEAMLAEITFCYTILDSGNNIFAEKYDYIKAFSRWTEEGNELQRLLKNLIQSDKKKYNKE